VNIKTKDSYETFSMYRRHKTFTIIVFWANWDYGKYQLTIEGGSHTEKYQSLILNEIRINSDTCIFQMNGPILCKPRAYTVNSAFYFQTDYDIEIPKTDSAYYLQLNYSLIGKDTLTKQVTRKIKRKSTTGLKLFEI